MTHPAYPDRQTLRREEMADDLLATQAESTARFVVARDAFIAVWDDLFFPLGSPVTGYDLDGIQAVLADWQCLEDDREDIAMDIARDVA